MLSATQLDAPTYYDHHAATLAERYVSVTFEEVHPVLLRHLPSAGRVLDIGAGIGRDAVALSARGLTVTAVEPSEALRQIGESAGDGVRWVDDRLPDLQRLGNEEAYDLILCSAVIMLVKPADLKSSFKRMAQLLLPNGLLVFSVRAPMRSEPSELFFDHGDDALLAAASSAGLVCIEQVALEDALNRTSIQWRNFVLRKKGSGSTRDKA